MEFKSRSRNRLALLFSSVAPDVLVFVIIAPVIVAAVVLLLWLFLLLLLFANNPASPRSN
jgi:hypothetical protein